MLNLDSPVWSELRHAYGTASDIPPLIRQLQGLPTSAGNDEPWFTLWSALAHQGDVYDASFAAVPHVVAALAQDPLSADETYFQFPAWVEICRAKSGIEVPESLASSYFEALSRLPSLVAAASVRFWDAGFLACALSAIAAAKGQPEIAEAVLELTTADAAAEFLEWASSR